MAAATTPVVRNSKGLVDTLFESIDKLNRKEITPEHSRAISHSARAIVGIASLELDYRRFHREGRGGPKKEDEAALRSLSMEGAADRLLSAAPKK